MTFRGVATRIRAAVGITGAQLWHHRLRLGLAIVGVVLAVLSVTLLAGAGLGVIDTGTQQFESADRDLWVTADETRITSAGGGGFENSLLDSRTVATEMETHDGVSNAVPLAFETIYIGTDPDDDFQTVIATGVPGSGSAVSVTDGEGLTGDPHYAGGTYDGNTTDEVLIDETTANSLDLEVGDTIYAGGSLSAARNGERTVVGISPTFEQMLGTPTVTMPLSELHATTGETGFEPATFITLSLEDDAQVETVQRDLQEDFPEYDIRTDQQQLEAVLGEQVLVLAGGVTIVGLAVVSGTALTVALLALVVHQQRRTVAALRAIGLSPRLLLVTVAGQGLVIGTVGGLIGVALTPPAASLLNHLGAAVVGFDGLVQTEPWVLAGGFSIAVGIGTLGSIVAGWRLTRRNPLEDL